MSGCRRGARGQSLLITALAFSLFLLGLCTLVADAAVLLRWSARVQAAAQLAAESGADSVSPGFLYGLPQPCPSSTEPGRSCPAPIVDIEPQDRRDGLYAFERACIQSGDQSAQIGLTPVQPQQPDGTRCDTDGCHVVASVTRSVALPIRSPGFPLSLPVGGVFRAARVVGSARPVATCAGGAWVPSTPP